MSVSKTIQSKIANIPYGVLFGYDKFKGIESSPTAMAKALDRLSDSGAIERFIKGVYYKPKQTVFGKLQPSESEKIKYLLSKGGYITGGTIYNQWGLSTQVPNVITIATTKPRRLDDLGGLKVRYVNGLSPKQKNDVVILQLLDVLKNVKNIPDRDNQIFVRILTNKLKAYTPKDLNRLVFFAKQYSPATRALLGALLESTGIESGLVALKKTINPISKFKLSINQQALPNQENWQIV